MHTIQFDSICLWERHFRKMVIQDGGKCGDNIAIGRPGTGLIAAQISSHVGRERRTDSIARYSSMRNCNYETHNIDWNLLRITFGVRIGDTLAMRTRRVRLRWASGSTYNLSQYQHFGSGFVQHDLRLTRSPKLQMHF